MLSSSTARKGCMQTIGKSIPLISRASSLSVGDPSTPLLLRRAGRCSCRPADHPLDAISPRSGPIRIIFLADGIEGMKWYRNDVRERAEKHGRNPDDVKVLFLVCVTLAETEAEARAKKERVLHSPAYIEQTLALISAITDIDFAKYALDSKLPHLTTNGEQGSLDKFQQWGSGKTLRQLVLDSADFVSSVELTGTPDSVADRMAEVMEDVGGDGFLITTPIQSVSRLDVIEVTDGLIPALQRRGLVRTSYTHPTLRENLRDF